MKSRRIRPEEKEVQTSQSMTAPKRMRKKTREAMSVGAKSRLVKAWDMAISRI